MKEKIPLMYLCIYSTLQNASIQGVISIKKTFELFGKSYRVPKNLKYAVLKELENFNLITRSSVNEINIIKTNIDLDNTSKIYKLVGLY